jgi:hypothetical protein
VYSVALCVMVNGALWECNIVALPILLSRERPVAISVYSEIFALEGRIIIFYNRLLWCSTYLFIKIYMLLWNFELGSIQNVWTTMSDHMISVTYNGLLCVLIEFRIFQLYCLLLWVITFFFLCICFL